MLRVAGTACCLALCAAAPAWAAPSGLDPSFSADGRQMTQVGARAGGKDVAVQPDGKVVVTGTIHVNEDAVTRFGVVRYLPNGALDRSFSGDGKTAVAFGQNQSNDARAVALQPDGRIVVVGSTNPAQSSYDSSDVALARLRSDGQLDTSFSSDGKQTAHFGLPPVDEDGLRGASDEANDVALQPDGRIVVAGDAEGRFALARLRADGALDTSFAGDGNHASTFSTSSQAYALALAPDGKIVAAGTRRGGDSNTFALARYRADGTLDTSFAGDGKQVTGFGEGGADAQGVALQPDGRIVLGGSFDDTWYSGPPNVRSKFALARYRPDGELDTSFGAEGRQTTSFYGRDVGKDLALQGDGKIVLAGTILFAGSPPSAFGLARYRPDGELDTSFSPSGRQVTRFGSADASGEAVTVQANGRIVVAGSADSQFASARYLDGSGR